MELMTQQVTGWAYRDIQAAILRQMLKLTDKWLVPLGKARNKQHVIDDLVQQQVSIAIEMAKQDGNHGQSGIKLKVDKLVLPDVELTSFGNIYCPLHTYYTLFSSPTEPKDSRFEKGVYYFLFTGTLWTENDTWRPATTDKVNKRMVFLKTAKDEQLSLLQKAQAILPATKSIVPFYGG